MSRNFSRRIFGFSKFLPDSKPCHLGSIKNHCFENSVLIFRGNTFEMRFSYVKSFSGIRILSV